MEPTIYMRELEQLDTQRARLLDLLASERLSPELHKHLRFLMDEVQMRMLLLQSEYQSQSASPHQSA